MPSRQQKITDFYDAWWFLASHPIFERNFEAEGLPADAKEFRFQESLDIYVPKVSPKSNHICDDKRKNTKTQVWLECGPWETFKTMGYKDEKGGAFTHDIDLDCGADTFEEAIIKLANLVLKKYGDYQKEV